jgi:hypothetical protein
MKIVALNSSRAGGESFALAAKLVHKMVRVARGPRNTKSVADRQGELNRARERNAMALRHIHWFHAIGRANRGTDLLAGLRIDQRGRRSLSLRRFFACADEERFGDPDRRHVQE